MDLIASWDGYPERTSSLFKLDPEYFSLSVRMAFRDDSEPDLYLDDCLAGVAEPEPEFLVATDGDLTDRPEVVEAGAAVADAEAAVLRAEGAGGADELAMRRLEKARAAERAVLVRLQKERTAVHTERAVSRTAQVVPMRPALRVIAGGEAA